MCYRYHTVIFYHVPAVYSLDFAVINIILVPATQQEYWPYCLQPLDGAKVQTWLTNGALSIPVNTEAAILDLTSSFDFLINPNPNPLIWDSECTHIHINIILF